MRETSTTGTEAEPPLSNGLGRTGWRRKGDNAGKATTTAKPGTVFTAEREDNTSDGVKFLREKIYVVTSQDFGHIHRGTL